MNKIDLIIDALECAIDDKFFNLNKYEKALAAARELKALQPVAWWNPEYGSEFGVAINEYQGWNVPLYALDEVKHEDAPLP